MADNEAPFVNMRTYLYVSLVLVATACTFFFFISYPNVGEIVRNEEFDRISIDFNALDNQMFFGVIGQREATYHLNRSLRQAFTDVLSERTNYTLIFLVGGPGVGKHHTLNIVRHYVKCTLSTETTKYVKKDTLYAWNKILRLRPYMEITNNVFKCNETSISFIDVKTINENYIRKHKNSTKLMSNFLNVITKEKSMTYIITGPIITNKTLNTITSKTQYENYINNVANQIRLSIPKEIADDNVNVIKFRPLDQEDVLMYLTHTIGEWSHCWSCAAEALKPLKCRPFIVHGCHGILKYYNDFRAPRILI